MIHIKINEGSNKEDKIEPETPNFNKKVIKKMRTEMNIKDGESYENKVYIIKP